MATENIPQIDKLFKCFEQQSKTDFEKINKQLKELGKAIKKFRESEGKSMLHNVTVKTSERKKLEQYWVARALKNRDMPFNYTKTVIGEMEFDHYPMPNEIAQFLSDSKADFVSVVQNYRFENELPFY